MASTSGKKIIGYQDTENEVGYLQVDVVPPISQKSEADAPATQKTPAPSATNTSTTQEPTENPSQAEQQKENDDRSKLNKLVNKKPQILFRLRSSSFFQIFKDEITIEEDKVNIVFRQFFFAEQLRSTSIKDITHIEVETSVLFATLKIASSGFVENFITIGSLWKKDAIQARQIIEGLRVLSKEEIDLTSLPSKEIVTKAAELGRAKGLE